MVIGKRNRKYIKKAAKAQVVDLMKLQNLHPERMEKAIKRAKENKWSYDRISLIKIWDDWYVYGLFANGVLMEKAILVNSKEDVHYGTLFQVEGKYFTIFEVNAWRGEVLAELLRIQNESPSVTNEQIAEDISILSTERVLRIMSAGNQNWVEDAREYAYIITM